ncbi:MAG TPA: hypothetical protein VJK73_02430 [Candidatus Paceibacterota bacterium]
MTTNPFLNALAAAAYIALVASMMFFGQRYIDPVDNVLMPMAMLSLLVLSAIVMTICFLYQPIQLFLNGDVAAATALLLKTFATFALITFLIFTTLFILSQLSGRVQSQTIESVPSQSSGVVPSG